MAAGNLPVYRKFVSNAPDWLEWVWSATGYLIFALILVFTDSIFYLLLFLLLIVFWPQVLKVIDKYIFTGRYVSVPILQVQDEHIVFKYPKEFDALTLKVQDIRIVETDVSKGYIAFSDSSADYWLMEYHIDKKYFRSVLDYLENQLSPQVQFLELDL